eukprot:6187434-Pleurochrysis_carterae.AAC.4
MSHLALGGRPGWESPGERSHRGTAQGACKPDSGNLASFEEVWGLPSLSSCLQLCEERPWCLAVEWASLQLYKKCELHEVPVN